jgi:protocatechuate 3,4-dioxygenase beta subunit
VIRGRVLDPDSKPVAGAKLYLNADAKESAYPVCATSGADGRFEFRCARSELEKVVSSDPWLARRSGNHVMAVAKGYGCDWAKMDADGKAGELTLRLVKDVPINGRVLDQDGKPVAGAKVRVNLLYAYPGEDLTEYLAAWRKKVRGPDPSKAWSGPLPEPATGVTTKQDGRFRLTGLGRERFALLFIEGPAIANGHCSVLTRVGPNKPEVFGLHHARFDYVAASSRPIRGVVRDQKTGKPLAGVKVNIQYGSVVPPPRFPVTTDKQGRYELLGFRKAPNYKLAVRPAAGQVHFGGVFEFTDTTGLTPLTADIELVPGIPLRGRVTDKEGKPVSKAVVTYHALYPNAYRSKLAREYKLTHSETVTGQDGSYSLAVFPGPGVVAVAAARREMYTSARAREKEIKDVFGGARVRGQTEDVLLTENGAFITEQHNALALLNPDEKADSLKRDFVLERGRMLQGSVVGPDGKPLTGARAWNALPEQLVTLETDAFTVGGLEPRRSRTLLFIHDEKDLAGGVVLRGNEKGPLTVKLQRHGDATGRIVDANGKPVAKVRLDCHVKGVRFIPPKLGGAITDNDGRFRVKGLIPGVEHELIVPGRVPWVVPVVAEPGKTRNLGDLRKAD